MLHIYIPTLGRSRTMLSLRQMPKAIRDATTLVVSPSERAEYAEWARTVVCRHQGVRGLNTVRDWVLDYAKDKGQRFIVLLDDDVMLQRRRPDGRITNASTQEYTLAMAWLERTLKTHAHCGWGLRFSDWDAKSQLQQYKECARAMHCLAFDLSAVAVAKARFSRGFEPRDSMSDFNMTLQLLRAGYPNRISLEWRAAPAKSNYAGGCSTYRTEKIQSASAKKLAALFPEYVALRPKKAWDGMGEGGGVMYDVSVKWKKALNDQTT